MFNETGSLSTLYVIQVERGQWRADVGKGQVRGDIGILQSCRPHHYLCGLDV